MSWHIYPSEHVFLEQSVREETQPQNIENSEISPHKSTLKDPWCFRNPKRWNLSSPPGRQFLCQPAESAVVQKMKSASMGTFAQNCPVASCSSSLIALSSTIPSFSTFATAFIWPTNSFLQPFFSSRDSFMKYLSMPLKRPWTENTAASAISAARVTGESTKLIICTALRISHSSE